MTNPAPQDSSLYMQEPRSEGALALINHVYKPFHTIYHMKKFEVKARGYERKDTTGFLKRTFQI